MSSYMGLPLVLVGIVMALLAPLIPIPDTAIASVAMVMLITGLSVMIMPRDIIGAGGGR